jgi:hypothetical protein
MRQDIYRTITDQIVAELKRASDGNSRPPNRVGRTRHTMVDQLRDESARTFRSRVATCFRGASVARHMFEPRDDLFFGLPVLLHSATLHQFKKRLRNLNVLVIACRVLAAGR